MGTRSKVTIELVYNDHKSSFVEVYSESDADLFMIARGWLMCSSASRITIWNEEGFDIMSYTK